MRRWAQRKGEESLLYSISVTLRKTDGDDVLLGFLLSCSSRKELYMSGGLISITSRILVVDMLTSNVPTEMITGLLVMHAEKSVAPDLDVRDLT